MSCGCGGKCGPCGRGARGPQGYTGLGDFSFNFGTGIGSGGWGTTGSGFNWNNLFTGWNSGNGFNFTDPDEGGGQSTLGCPPGMEVHTDSGGSYCSPVGQQPTRPRTVGGGSSGGSTGSAGGGFNINQAIANITQGIASIFASVNHLPSPTQGGYLNTQGSGYAGGGVPPGYSYNAQGQLISAQTGQLVGGAVGSLTGNLVSAVQRNLPIILIGGGLYFLWRSGRPRRNPARRRAIMNPSRRKARRRR